MEPKRNKIFHGSRSNWNENPWTIRCCYKPWRSGWHLVVYCSSGENQPAVGCSGFCAWIPWVSMRWKCLIYESMWRQKHTWSYFKLQWPPPKNQDGPFPAGLPKQCCMEWQWPPNNNNNNKKSWIFVLGVKIWRVILMRFFDGYVKGFTSQKHHRWDVVKTCSWTSQVGSELNSGLKMTHTDTNKTGWSQSGTTFLVMENVNSDHW